jgi:aquaporin Z
MNSLVKKAIAECLGTFVLVFFAVGTAIISGGDLVATALAFGLVIVAMAYSIGKISGCHINPAVSIACLITKRMSLKEFLVYVCAQIVGGLLAAIIFFGLTKWCLAGTGVDLYYVSGNASNFAPFYSAFGKLNAARIITALVVEIVLTFIFVYVILNVTSEKSDAKNLAGLIIGITLIGVHLVGISITGTSVNPARSIATAVSTAIYGGGKEALKQVWMFIVGPMAGACLAGVFYKFFHNDETSSTEE